MTNRRLFLTGGAGILLLFLAGLLAVAWFGSGDRPAGPAAEAVVAGSPTPAPPEAAVVPPPPVSTKPIAPSRRRPVAEAATAWAEVPIAARPYDLGPELARPVMAALDAARGQMDPCFEDEDRALAQGKGPRFDPRNPPTGPAVLVLRLESRAGALDVVEAELDSLGTSTRALAVCCQQILKGWPVPAPLAVPGHRYRLVYLLN
jgi:hypothetical protein